MGGMEEAIISTETQAEWLRVADLLSNMPALIARLIVEHDVDDEGHCRSRRCRTPGTGTGRVEHPCPIARLATTALQIRAERPRPVRGALTSDGKPSPALPLRLNYLKTLAAGLFCAAAS